MNSHLRKWMPFHDVYSNMIHTDIDKFQYLTSCSYGEVLLVVQQLCITLVNCKIIWNKFIDIFNNPQFLVRAYIDDILNLQALNTGTSTNKWIMLDTFRINYMLP